MATVLYLPGTHFKIQFENPVWKLYICVSKMTSLDLLKKKIRQVTSTKVKKKLFWTTSKTEILEAGSTEKGPHYSTRFSWLTNFPC